MSKKQGADAVSASADKGSKREGAPSSRKNEEGGIATRIADFKEYLVLSRAELRKVSWPTWKETRATALVVLGFVPVMAILLGLVDLALSSVIRFILS